MVVGPSSSFGSASLWQDHQTSAVYWGIMGSVKLLHENFTYSVLLSAVQGVRDVSVSDVYAFRVYMVCDQIDHPLKKEEEK